MIFLLIMNVCFIFFFFFNDTATTEIYTLSLHDALPICFRFWRRWFRPRGRDPPARITGSRSWWSGPRDRKSTRLNSSHDQISYAVFCLKKKKKQYVTIFLKKKKKKKKIKKKNTKKL